MSGRRATASVAATAAVVVVLAACGQRSGAHVVAQLSPTAPPVATAATPPTIPPTVSPPPRTSGVSAGDPGRTAGPPSPTPDAMAAASASERSPEPWDDATRQRQPAASPPAAPDPGAPLWGRTFASVRVTEQGRQKALASGTRLRVNPFKRDGEGGIRYSGDCNVAGASLAVSPTRFDVGDDGASTAVGCPEDQQQQGEWFWRFVTSDPHWSLSKDHRFLELTSGDTVILFEEHPWPPYGEE